MSRLKYILSFILSIGLLASVNPASARFLSVDPVGTIEHLQNGNIQGFNRYAYGNNNPYKYVDPDGRAAVTVTAILIFAGKEILGEVFEQTTGIPAPTVKNLGKAAGKQVLKSTRSLRGRKSFSDATAINKRNNGGMCEFCGKNEATHGDHIRPLNEFKKDVNSGKMTKADAKDIANRADNNAAACPTCNSAKGTKTLGSGPNGFTPSNPSPRIKARLN